MRQLPQSPVTTQLDLMRDILDLLESKYGAGVMCDRNVDAVRRGVIIMRREFVRAYKPFEPGMGFNEWAKCDDVCRAAAYIARVCRHRIAGYENVTHRDYPMTADDLLKCYWFTLADPLVEGRLHLLSIGHGVPWRNFAMTWAAIKPTIAKWSMAIHGGMAGESFVLAKAVAKIPEKLTENLQDGIQAV